MEITIHSLNEKNHKDFELHFEQYYQHGETIVLDFNYLYSIDFIGFNTLLRLRRKAKADNIEIQIVGKSNPRLKAFLNDIKLRGIFAN